MLDIRWIRNHPEALDQALARRGAEAAAARILSVDREWRMVRERIETLRERRNTTSKEIAQLKKSGAQAESEARIENMAALRTAIQENEEQERARRAERDALLAELPNLPAPDVPDGADETSNVEIRRCGQPRMEQVPEHDDIGRTLGLMDFVTAGRISGARFVVLSGALSRLERALAAFMLDLHCREFGYREISPPFLVRPEAMFGTGQLPKFSDQSFVTRDDYWLIPTAEVPLTNLMREQIIMDSELPLRYTAWTPCFRREAGAAGRDTRGMFRQHQFSKVELVSLTHPADSAAELERMLSCAETVLERLGLAWRVVLLSAGDMGAAAHKTYDIEVWLPSRREYREISSCSVCGDYQARRMNTRRRSENGTIDFIHTLNGSGVAVGRCMIALLETWCRPDGRIEIPESIRPYMGGESHIEPES